MSVRRITILTLLLAAAFGSWYLSQTLSRQPAARPAAEIRHDGFYLRSARVLGTDDSGSLLYRIEAEYAEQVSPSETEFQNVRILYASLARVPWTLVADRASIGEDQQRVTLTGNVMAVSNEGFSGDVTEIRTQYLEFEPDTFIARTEDRVQIRIGSRSLTATGMLALLQENQLRLISNVSGKFVP
ncbi:MAG: LPS export ABC transporter periplasmic protein LptC [Gammaproteobacteria bacterium]|nr:LPS export ABC transporter periplasmic protein LptC [Gammaproteobacteria bacterium]MDH4315150.1 LPS export ABC transporter periplasmic protein LptC [Gammaproteobacteria bacterium]MDH5213603.1 LPS export ABC transporter periplasmic protein LptC [Gammaproteobacteria bacterium]MDH5501593.1 LPS export ABC transporter periplasmic protein LptC [Gammaproteobacteria bacterium]